MKNLELNQYVENKAFIAACATFAKECGITAEDWNTNKGHFVGVILAMAKLNGQL